MGRPSVHSVLRMPPPEWPTLPVGTGPASTSTDSSMVTSSGSSGAGAGASSEGASSEGASSAGACSAGPSSEGSCVGAGTAVPAVTPGLSSSSLPQATAITASAKKTAKSFNQRDFISLSPSGWLSTASPQPAARNQTLGTSKAVRKVSGQIRTAGKQRPEQALAPGGRRSPGSRARPRRWGREPRRRPVL